MLREWKEEITAFADFPEAHWVKVWSTNSLERLNKEVDQRSPSLLAHRGPGHEGDNVEPCSSRKAGTPLLTPHISCTRQRLQSALALSPAPARGLQERERPLPRGRSRGLGREVSRESYHL